MASRIDLPEWAREAIEGGSVGWRIRSRSRAGQAEVVQEGATKDQVFGLFRRKYGSERIARWFVPDSVCLALRPDPGQRDYDRIVEDFFDNAAVDYDSVVQSNPLDRGLRAASLALLRQVFRTEDRVLELGAGTGLETIPLAQMGVRVVAVDISRKMLEQLTAKARKAGVENRITTRWQSASRLVSVLHEEGPGRFDGAFSTFGALNCEPHWETIVPVLGSLLRPKAPLVLAAWNRLNLLEMAAYAAALKPRRALARLNSPVPPGFSRFAIPVYPHTVREFVRRFSPAFAVEAVLGLPVFLPPYDLARRLPRMSRLYPILDSVDSKFRERFPLNRLGDHFVLVLRRR